MTADNTTLARFIANYQSEREGAALYREMAAHEPHAELAELYVRLARVEETHAEFWRRRIVTALQPRVRWAIPTTVRG